MSIEHPAPWRWNDEHGRETVLWDANGNVVLAYGNDSTIVVASPLVRELVAASREMEALLRDRVRWYGGEPDASWLIDRNALLARIDAAKAAT